MGLAATSTFNWDYRNRMIRAWVSGATSTYAYDHTTARMAQITLTTTTHYPNKFYSIEYQGAGTTTATSTAYIFHGDTLVAYIEQAIEDGVATGTPTTYYVHPDHLGSTNVVTDENGDVVEALDYYPYGAERIHSGRADADRTFIGQFGDDPTALGYLMARYYDPARGQFTSQDPVHLAIGNPAYLQGLTGKPQRVFLSDPQSMNSYSYGRDNPIAYKDPTGNATYMWNNGAGMSGRDTWNRNTYYESQDQAMLSANASFGEANRGNLVSFYNQVKPNGGAWNYKQNSERGYYFFNGKLVSAEVFGNLNYGYAGTAFGFGEDILTDAAGMVQIATAGKDNRGPTMSNVSGNFDDPRDTANIRTAVTTYNNSPRPNSSSGYASASNAAYNATIRNISRAISAISAALKSYSTKKSTN